MFQPYAPVAESGLTGYVCQCGLKTKCSFNTQKFIVILYSNYHVGRTFHFSMPW